MVSHHDLTSITGCDNANLELKVSDKVFSRSLAYEGKIQINSVCNDEKEKNGKEKNFIKDIQTIERKESKTEKDIKDFEE